jgi:hypothetical protein
LKIEVHYSDGRKEVIPQQIGCVKVEDVVHEEGLFSWKRGGTFFRIGKYKGCNVDSETSISQYFNNWLDFYSYVIACLKPTTIGKLKQSPETLERSVEKLTELKEGIESKLPEFSSTLKSIRLKKGLGNGN